MKLTKLFVITHPTVVILYCLLLLGLACGPSEREIEATVEARIRATETAVVEASTATAIANLPTATPIVESPTGLILPSRVREQPVAHEKMSLADARRKYREIGCTDCSTDLAEEYERLTGGPGVYADYAEIIIGEFLGGDNLPDAVLLVRRIQWHSRQGSWVAYYHSRALIHTGVGLDQTGQSRLDNRLPDLLRRYGENVREGLKGDIRNYFTTARSKLFATSNLEDSHVYLVTYYDREMAISNLTTEDGAGFSRILNYWFGDFDNDNAIEMGALQEDPALPFVVIEIVDGLGNNDEATETIARAAKDFASNLLANDEDDFKLLWEEHGPSASVVALALILDMPFHNLLDRFYTAVDDGEDIRKTVLEIRQSRR